MTDLPAPTATLARRMTAPTIAVRAGCPGLRHDTASAYRKHRCRCPKARDAELERKKKYDAGRGSHNAPQSRRIEHLTKHIVAAVPEFASDPRRGCADLDNPDVMFPQYAHEVPAAQKICRRCPFRDECAAFAISTGQTYGVWGGMSEKERRKHIANRLNLQVNA